MVLYGLWGAIAGAITRHMLWRTRRGFQASGHRARMQSRGGKGAFLELAYWPIMMTLSAGRTRHFSNVNDDSSTTSLVGSLPVGGCQHHRIRAAHPRYFAKPNDRYLRPHGGWNIAPRHLRSARPHLLPRRIAVATHGRCPTECHLPTSNHTSDF